MTMLHLLSVLISVIIAATGPTVICVMIGSSADRIMEVLGWRRGYDRTVSRMRLMRA